MNNNRLARDFTVPAVPAYLTVMVEPKSTDSYDCWVEFILINTNKNTIIHTDGFGRTYSRDATKRFTILIAGDYQLNLTGNRAVVHLTVRSDKDPIPSRTSLTATRTTTIPPRSIAPTPASTAGGRPPIDTAHLEQRIHALINEQRSQQGLSSLRLDSTLSDIARRHSQDMAQNSYFSHVNLQGQDPTDRGNAVGYTCRKDYGSYYTYGLAENIFQNNLYNSVRYLNGRPVSYDWNTLEDLAQSTVAGWMNSPGHRKNILTSTYDREGIGVAIAADDKVYITQDFC